MARDGAGNYSLASGNPVTTGTVISSTWANNTLSDIATAVTGSVAADGQTTITGALKGAVGSVGAPGYTFTGDTDTGGWHPAADTLAWSVAGAEGLRLNSTKQLVSGTLGAVGAPSYTFTGDLDTGAWSPAANTLAWSTAGAEAVRIDSSQNVGIGVTPAERLDISSGASATLIRFRNGSASSGYIGYDATSLKFYTTALERLVLTSDGRFYGTALHNNAGAVTGPTNQYVASGTYTPTAANVANAGTPTPSAAQWMRVGNVVTVSGKVALSPTASVATTFTLTLPIASTLGAGGETLAGVGACLSGNTSSLVINPDTGQTKASLSFTASSTSSQTWMYTYTYVVA